MTRPPSLSIGIEEEYLLVDRASRNIVSDPPPGFMKECERRLGPQVAPELQRSQVEIGTRVCASVKEARGDLARLRATIADVAAEHGLAPIAASTHPFARWQDQHYTDKERYRTIADELEMVARRALICGMHVHVGVEDPGLRIALMNEVRYFLPHLLMLSTSSPFWEGDITGLLSYRLSVFHNLPRTGLPERFESVSEYDRLVTQFVDAGVIDDATKLWWDVRPSARFPTLEMRITDMCTRLDDAVSVAALYRCLVGMLWRRHGDDARRPVHSHLLLEENRWRAQRYGTEGLLLEVGKGEARPFAKVLDEVIGLVRPEAERFDCLAEVSHALEIPGRGTSAHTQQHVYNSALAAGAETTEALRAVVDWLIEETVNGLGPG